MKNLGKNWIKISCLTVVVLIAAAAYFSGILQFNYPSKEKYSVRGIDISHHQGEIDWSLIPKNKISFVYIKATEGKNWVDPNFQRNVDGANIQGLKTGAYHFFTFCNDGKAQAENFLKTISSEKFSLPPAIDLEYVGNCSKIPDRKAFLNELQSFLKIIERHYKMKPIFYTTHKFYDDYLTDSPYASYSLWIRDVFFEPSWKKYSSAILWQYTDKARVAGIKGLVDMNTYLAKEGSHNP